MDLISIIIPVYNLEKYLVPCLDSVLAQTYKELEIILVDDGSQDGTGKICDEYAQKDGRIRVLHKKNGGVSSARNAGLEMASGDYFSFVDGDDYIDPEMYQILHNNAVQYGAEISCCGIEQKKLDGSTDSLSDAKIMQLNRKELLTGFFSDPIIKETMYGPYNKIFKAEVLRGKKFDERFALGEDLLFLFGCLENVDRVVLDNRPLYQYLKRPQSATTSSFSEKRLHYIKVADILCEKCRRDHPEALSAAICWTYYHKLVLLRSLNKYTDIKGKNAEFYRDCLAFVEAHKQEVWTGLPGRRKIDYFLVRHFPWAYRFLPI